MEEYYERVQTSTGLETASRLFRVALERGLWEMVDDKSLHEAVATLFTFRNGLLDAPFICVRKIDIKSRG